MTSTRNPQLAHWTTTEMQRDIYYQQGRWKENTIQPVSQCQSDGCLISVPGGGFCIKCLQNEIRARLEKR